MSIISSLIANWRIVGIAFLCIALPIAGWVIKGKFERAAEADALATQLEASRAQIDAERKAHAESEAARIKISAELAVAEGQVHETVREVVRKVPVLVRDNRACDLSDELTSQLNKLRGYQE